MEKKLYSSIFIEPKTPGNQDAHGLTASIMTRQGFDLHIAAVSQKKPGLYAPIDTPRKTLLSFVTSLQSGGDSTLEQLVQRAIGLVTTSTGSYVKRRNGAPCSLSAAIAANDKLHLFQIGAGEILHQHGDKLDLLTDGANGRGLWLGEPNDFSLDNISFQTVDLHSDSAVFVCQSALQQAITSQHADFSKMMLEQTNVQQDLAKVIANWSAGNGIETGLTIATHRFAIENRVQIKRKPEPAEPEPTADEAELIVEEVTPHESLESDGAVESGESDEPNDLTDPNDLLLKYPKIKKGELDFRIQASSPVLFDSQEEPTVRNEEDIPFSEVLSEAAQNSSVTDTIRMNTLGFTPAAPKRSNGKSGRNGSSVPTLVPGQPVEPEKAVNMRVVFPEEIADDTNLPIPPIEPLQDEETFSPELVKTSRNYRLLGITSAGLFLALILVGGFVVIRSMVFGDSDGNSLPIVAAEVDTAELVEVAASEQNGAAVGVWSQGSSEQAETISDADAYGARGLTHFALDSDGPADGPDSGKKKHIYAWAGSQINFVNSVAGSTFGLDENSTIFLDSTESTVRPELIGLFGMAESSAGCMAISYKTVDKPLTISCYAGSCRWLGPLNQTIDVPAGNRIQVISTNRDLDEIDFKPVLFTETTVAARTLGSISAGRDISDQCLEPYLAEDEQMSAEQTAVVASQVTDRMNREIGWWRQGTSRYLYSVDRGDTLNVRGLIRMTLAVDVDQGGTEGLREHNVYAWPGSEIHFDPKLADNEFDVSAGSTLFLDSTDSVIRPFFSDLFGTAESSNGCMAVSYQGTSEPLILSCYSGVCEWQGALERNYEIPVGQRLAVDANLRGDEQAVFEPIYRTETAVLARTLGAIPAGLEISNRCVEPYLINPEQVIVAPLATLTPDSDAEEATAESTERLPTLDTGQDESSN